MMSVRLTTKHVSTGKTQHFVGGELMSRPEMLKTVQYPGDSGYDRSYCNEEGVEATDTWHETVDKAMDQADWEFQMKPEDWTKH